MALKQSRRSVSLNAALYKAAVIVAEKRGVTLSQLVADALRSSGVKAPPTQHVTAEAQAKVTQMIRASIPDREALRRKKKIERALGKRPAKEIQRLPGPIRRALGDDIANMCGEP